MLQFTHLNSKVKYGKCEKEIVLNPFLFSFLKQCVWASEGLQALWQVRGCRDRQVAVTAWLSLYIRLYMVIDTLTGHMCVHDQHVDMCVV